MADKLSDGIHTFQAGDNTLSYHITPSKKPNAPLWVTQSIHWGPGRQVYVNTLAPILSKHYTVLDFSPRGNDESSRPKNASGIDDPSAMSVTHVTDDLESLRKYLSLEAFPILAGHSLAGVSILLYASLYPTRVETLVPIAAGIFAGYDGTAVWNHFRDIRSSQPQWKSSYERWATAKTNPPQTDEDFGQFLMDVLPSYLADPEKSYAATVAGFEGSKMRLWCQRSYFGTMAGDQGLQGLYDLLKDVRAKRVLFVHGEEDMACPVEAARVAEGRLRDGADGVEVLFEGLGGVGHFPWVEDGREFERVVFGGLGDE
ncbi:hypothetical protein M409DRAFT_22013 [Zasmidium cellare ATCC 36951]|uniref:AB hydrolase-1 domain-containing protein n=1 Tax=Zasmidium cellare ATCC 36951 TaxID=1080233 RepID=A0A6A6CL46_ZASCE|nr:uncharacterized protein M409DRAFT_22013 [Zasmidium cellare ATCC 36951]KAF2167865.1 hypothetical protein M409DRAFT_22013 [Zasmidium cellare ATCC 36951]